LAFSESYLIKHHTPANGSSSDIPCGYARIWKMRVISGKRWEYGRRTRNAREREGMSRRKKNVSPNGRNGVVQSGKWFQKRESDEQDV
jgi:hypothetical protein